MSDDRCRHQPGRALPAHRPHASHLVSGLRHRHDGQLLRAGAHRFEDRSGLAGPRLGHRLHGARGRLRQAGFVPHHPWTRHSLRHRPEAGESQVERRGVFRRWRSLRHRRQSSDSRRPPQHRPESDLRQQPDLRHDRRPDRAHHARPRHHLDQSLTARSSPPSTFRTWWKRPALCMWPAGRPSTCANWRAPSAKLFRRRASASSKSSRPARRSISDATRWATASTP